MLQSLVALAETILNARDDDIDTELHAWAVFVAESGLKLLNFHASAPKGPQLDLEKLSKDWPSTSTWEEEGGEDDLGQ